MVGTTISRCKVLEKIGQGGMGEVYPAQDTSLSRFYSNEKSFNRNLGQMEGFLCN